MTEGIRILPGNLVAWEPHKALCTSSGCRRPLKTLLRGHIPAVGFAMAKKKKKKGICRYKSGHEIKPWRYSCSEAKKIKDEFPHNFLSLFLQVIEFDDGSGSVLRIQPLRTPRDEAIYECHASNSAGEITASTRLSVLRGQSGGVSTPSSFPNCTPLLTSSFWAISRCWGKKGRRVHLLFSGTPC